MKKLTFGLMAVLSDLNSDIDKEIKSWNQGKMEIKKKGLSKKKETKQRKKFPWGK